MKDGYKIGFWNYVDTGVLDAESAADDWKALGMNTPMSFEYDPAKNKKEEMLSQLDACEKRGMKLIVCDARTTFSRYIAVGEEEFRAGVKQAAAEFSHHPAFFGFHVGDEPAKAQWQAAVNAYIVCREETDEMPFINFLPYWDEDNFEETLGVKGEEYGALVEDFLRKTGAKKFGYDYYGQCAYFERERFVDLYFKNLNIRGGAELRRGTVRIPPFGGALVARRAGRGSDPLADRHFRGARRGGADVVFRVRAAAGRQFPPFSRRFILGENGNLPTPFPPEQNLPRILRQVPFRPAFRVGETRRQTVRRHGGVFGKRRDRKDRFRGQRSAPRGVEIFRRRVGELSSRQSVAARAHVGFGAMRGGSETRVRQILDRARADAAA